MSNIRVSSVTRISTAADGTQGYGDSGSPDGTRVIGSDSFGAAFSPDGTRVIFTSGASNFVAGDTNGAYDVFIKDLTTGAITRISTASDGAQFSNDSYFPVFSRDGSKIAFVHDNDDDNDWSPGYLKDLTTGALTPLSTQVDGDVNAMDFSPDGRSLMVLTTGKLTGTVNFSFEDLSGGMIRQVMTGMNSVGFNAHYSPDGGKILFSARASGIFLLDVATSAITPVSMAANGSFAPVFSPDGTKVAFDSPSSNLVAGDTNAANDIFIKDLTTGAVTRVSTAADGTQANGSSYGPVYSPDGQWIAFSSDASNLVPGDTNGRSDVFVKDLTTGAIARVSTSADQSQSNGDSSSYLGLHFSPDGKKLLYSSDASNLVPGDTNGHTDIFVATFGSTYDRAAIAGDFNGDGKFDILWQNNDGQSAEWLLDGNAVMATSLVGPNPGSSWHNAGAGDFNGDGKFDILWQNADGSAGVWLMNGTNVVSATNVGNNPGPSWQVKGTGDFNGDGKSDILWQKYDGSAGVWLMNGTNVVGATNVGPNPGPAWYVKGAGDFNGDGKADILWQNADGSAGVWLMDGTNVVFGTNVGNNPGPAWHAMGAGDFNGDGKADILWQNDDGQMGIWLMNGTTPITATNVGSNPGSTWHVGQVGDFNDDGKSDVLWQNDDGSAGVWLMDGTAVVSATNVGDNPGTAWHIDWT